MRRINVYSKLGTFLNISRVNVKKTGLFKGEIIGFKDKQNIFDTIDYYTIWEGCNPDLDMVVEELNDALLKGDIDVVIKGNEVRFIAREVKNENL